MPSLPQSKFSKNANTPLPSMKKCRDPARWVMAEEAAIIATLLLQKATRNSSESGFKLAVWPLVVNAVSQATSVAIKKTPAVQDLLSQGTCTVLLWCTSSG